MAVRQDMDHTVEAIVVRDPANGRACRLREGRAAAIDDGIEAGGVCSGEGMEVES